MTMDIDRNSINAEEEIMRHRLTNDNEGNGDEKRINLFVKTFLTYVQCDKNSPDADANYRKLCLSLDQFEHHLMKNSDIQIVSTEDFEHYNELVENLKRSVETARVDLSQKNKELEHARSTSRMRHEYNALLQSMKKMPDSTNIQSRLAELGATKCELTQKLKILSDSLDTYKQEYTVCINSLMSLKEKVDISSNPQS